MSFSNLAQLATFAFAALIFRRRQSCWYPKRTQKRNLHGWNLDCEPKVKHSFGRGVWERERKKKRESKRKREEPKRGDPKLRRPYSFHLVSRQVRSLSDLVLTTKLACASSSALDVPLFPFFSGQPNRDQYPPKECRSITETRSKDDDQRQRKTEDGGWWRIEERAHLLSRPPSIHPSLLPSLPLSFSVSLSPSLVYVERASVLEFRVLSG